MSYLEKIVFSLITFAFFECYVFIIIHDEKTVNSNFKTVRTTTLEGDDQKPDPDTLLNKSCFLSLFKQDFNQELSISCLEI